MNLKFTKMEIKACIFDLRWAVFGKNSLPWATNINMSWETSREWDTLANIRISFKVCPRRKAGGDAVLRLIEKLNAEKFLKLGSRAETEPTGTETHSLPSGSLSNTRKIIVASRTAPSPWRQFELQRSVTCMGEERGGWGVGSCAGGGGESWASTYSTVYSECIVKCVCRQVLLNYIFVCKMETDVSFFYGGTTGSEQRNL